MNITVERAAFLDAVNRLQRAVGAKTAMPVLEGILISAEKGQVTLASYNLETGMKKVLYANCTEEGDVVINARLLSDILRRMNGIQVEISADEKLLCHIKSGEAVFEIMGMNANDFPEMPSVSDGKRIAIDGAVFSDMVRGVIYATAQESSTRPVMTGIDISVKDGVLQMVALDGYRLAIRREPVNIPDEIEFIASGRAIGEVVKLIDEQTDQIEMIVGKRLISLDINGYLFISRLFEGDFVNYQKTIPAAHSQMVVIDRHELIEKIESVSVLISDSFISPLRCMFTENEVIFSCTTTMGRGTDKLPISLEGLPFEIGLNSRYLLEALKAAYDDRVKILFNGIGAGVVIRSADDANNEYFYMIMPVRIKNGS